MLALVRTVRAVTQTRHCWLVSQTNGPLNVLLSSSNNEPATDHLLTDLLYLMSQLLTLLADFEYLTQDVCQLNWRSCKRQIVVVTTTGILQHNLLTTASDSHVDTAVPTRNCRSSLRHRLTQLFQHPTAARLSDTDSHSCSNTQLPFVSPTQTHTTSASATVDASVYTE